MIRAFTASMSMASAVLASLGAVLVGAPARADEAAAARYVPGQLLVQFNQQAGEQAKAAIRSRLGAMAEKSILTAPMRAGGRGVLEVLKLPPGISVEDAARLAAEHPDVDFAEPNWIYHRQAQSNDPGYTQGLLWGMYGDMTNPANQYGSQAGEAWGANFIGSRDVLVGVIDEGIQNTHPDLSANIWSNPFDPVDGVDNDGNGFIDDSNGWDFVNDDRTIFDGGPGSSVDRHGTHVSGTIGAVGGNAKGVVGVNWQVTIISGKFLGRFGGSTSDAILALDYFTDLKTRHGLNIVATNNSWGGGGFSQALLDAIVRSAQAGILFVAAAGNGGGDGVGDNNDVTPSYPSNYDTTAGAGYDAVVAVAAISSSGGLASFSNFGDQTVDLGAPGVDIGSTLPFNTYGYLSGTSMATPHVTGAVALYASACPATSAQKVRQAILQATQSTPSLVGKTVTDGRLNISNLRRVGCL